MRNHEQRVHRPNQAPRPIRRVGTPRQDQSKQLFLPPIREQVDWDFEKEVPRTRTLQGKLATGPVSSNTGSAGGLLAEQVPPSLAPQVLGAANPPWLPLLGAVAECQANFPGGSYGSVTEFSIDGSIWDKFIEMEELDTIRTAYAGYGLRS